jgi:hypothetical protein
MSEMRPIFPTCFNLPIHGFLPICLQDTCRCEIDHLVDEPSSFFSTCGRGFDASSRCGDVFVVDND